jgi:hypothetical protein
MAVLTEIARFAHRRPAAALGDAMGLAFMVLMIGVTLA